MRHWATCHRPTGGICSRRCGCPCHSTTGEVMRQAIEEARARGDVSDDTLVFTPAAYDWRTEVDPAPTGIPAHWWALGAITSTVAGAIDRFRRRWWWPWP